VITRAQAARWAAESIEQELGLDDGTITDLLGAPQSVAD
jgi:hypothetical protein